MHIFTERAVKIKIKQFDCVQLKDGRIGTVVEIFDNGKAFMVEFADDVGVTLDMPIVESDEFANVTYTA